MPAPTRTGHIEKSSLKKQHPKACSLAKIAAFPLYTFPHTCLTRWAAYMDPYTLAYLAGHSDFSRLAGTCIRRHIRSGRQWNARGQRRVATILGTVLKCRRSDWLNQLVV